MPGSSAAAYDAFTLEKSSDMRWTAVLLVAFVGPKVYETYKEHIDRGISQAQVCVAHQTNRYSLAALVAWLHNRLLVYRATR